METERIPYPICHACGGKVCYPSSRRAKEIANYIKTSRRGKKRIPVRPYPCPENRYWWHLASKKDVKSFDKKFK